jgi:hypothetical protein
VTARESLPTDLAAAHALILAERTARVEAEAKLAVARAEAANAQADLSSTEAFISHLKLEIEKLRRQLYGTRSASPAPRRPGRADFPHPVLHAQASLTEQHIGRRSSQKAVDVERAWFGSGARANCCADRAARAISSISGRAGDDTIGSDRRFR